MTRSQKTAYLNDIENRIRELQQMMTQTANNAAYDEKESTAWCIATSKLDSAINPLWDALMTVRDNMNL